MKLALMAAAGATLAAPACAFAAASCPAPKFTVSDLKIGDGKLDRGWIGGVSLADADNDGDLDLYASRGYDTGPTPPKPPHPDRSMLYLNDGKGSFARAEDNALSNGDHYTSGSTWADMDADGDLDVFVSTQVGKPDVFYRNLGGGRFEKQPLGPVTEVKASNFMSSWVDIDGDGDLDLMSGGPTLEKGAPMLIYRNDDGAFVQVKDTPIDNGPNNPGAALWADLDNDGDQDLFVANSDILRRSKMTPAPVEHPVVYLNDGGWKFRRAEGQGFDDIRYASASAALGDFDGDGVLDVHLGGYTFKPTPPAREFLFRGVGDGTFREVAGFDLVERSEWATGAAFVDVDLDGDQDLLTGAFQDGIRLYLNEGAGLRRAADPVLDSRKKTHSGAAAGDLDGDGDLDAVFGDWGDNVGGQFVSLVRNDSARCGDWVEISPLSRAGAPNPPGLRITLVSRAKDGKERRQLREASAQTAFRSQGASFFLYGAPKDEKLVRAEVRWPNGRTEIITRLKRNGRITIRDR